MASKSFYWMMVVVVWRATMLADGRQFSNDQPQLSSLSGGSVFQRFGNHHNHQIMSSSSSSSLLLPQHQYQYQYQPHQPQHSSVHRFSNLYGTILHCQDFLTTITTTTATNQGSMRNGNNNNNNNNNHHHTSHLPLPPQSSSTMMDNDLERDLQTLLMAYHQHQPPPSSSSQSVNSGLIHNHGHIGGRYQKNFTFEWQVRINSRNIGGAATSSNPKLSSSSSASNTVTNKQQQQYQRAFDQTNLRLTNMNDGTLALAPFDHDSFVPDIHDAFYRCLVRLPRGTQMADSVEQKHHPQQQQPPHTIITSREVHIQAVVERLSKSSSSLPTELSASIATSANNNNKIVSSSSSTATSSSSSAATSRAFEDQIRIRIHNSTEVLEGNDAILKCEFDHRNSLYKVYAWYRDDGKIYLPLERLVHTIRRTLGPSQGSGSSINYVNYSSIRHFVIPASGDLLISSVTYRDAKHRYRCQIRHVITNHRQYSQSWAHILFKKTSDYYNSGPRLNPQLQSRHTVAIDEGEPAFFYCSFDGYPQPTIEWFHMDLKSLSSQQSSNQPVLNAFSAYFAQSSSNLGSTGHLDDGEAREGAKEQPESMLPISKQTSNQYIYGRNFLAIEKVSIEDTGIIACVANNSNSIVRHEMLLFVKNFLQVSLQTSNPLPFPGQDVTLSCNLTTVSSTMSTISAFNVFDSLPLANDDPRYQEQQRWLLQEKRFRELISSHFMLNINWFHNGHLIDFDHRKRRQAEELLMIRDFRGPEDNGVYQCSIRLTAPDYDEEPFMAAIQIYSIEKFPEFVDVFTEQIKQNDNQKRDYLSLKCSAHAIPTPQIVWYLDGQELYSNGHVRIETFLDSFGGSGGVAGSSSSNSPLARTLTVSFLNISSFHSKDVGMYECVAENYLGAISHRARINQMGSPFIKPLANQTAVLGRPYTINCTYGGYPLEEVYFIKGRHSGSYPSAKTGGQSGQAKRMPFDERHLVPMLGSITITVVEKSDQDFYRCIVVTSNGQKAEQEFYLNVAIAPVISPIIFSDNFEEGKRGSAVCTVTSGDPPILISWFKDGILLDHISTGGGRGAKSSSIMANNIHFHLNQIQIVPINEFMSSLIIANISRHHQGTYTCMATSPVATTNVSAFLSVKATPIWLLKPSDRIAISGESLTLDCQTSGQPQPVIRWKFLKNEPYRNEPMPILSSQQVHVLENGSLYLRALEPKHSGIYICDASNEISKYPIESRAYVGVSSLPKVSIQNTLGNTVANSMGGGNGGSMGQSSSIIAKESNSMYRGFTLDRLILRKGSQTQLMCSVIGLEQPMVAEWLRPNGETNGGELNADKTTMKKSYLDSSRIVLREETKMNEKRAYLYISHVQRMDSGVYCCMGINPNGHSVSFIELLIQEQPDMPVNFRSVEINSRSVTLNWSIQFDGNSPITSYIVEYRMLPLIKRSFSKNPGTQQLKQLTEPGEAKNNNNNNNKILTAKSLTNTITINGLQPQSRYEFRVCAINDLGASQFSEPLILTTEMEAPSLIPIDLRTLVLGSRSIKLIWSIVQPISMDKHPHQQQQQQQPSTTITTTTMMMMMMAAMNPPLEQIDGFYIGYRPVLSSSSSSSSSLPSISSAGSGSSSSGSIDPSMMMIGSMDQSNIINNNNGGPMMDPKTVNSNNNNGKMIPYTFKTMYNLDQNSMLATLLTNGSLGATVSNNNNNENKLASGNNNNNMTTFCEIVRRGNGDVDDPSADNPAPSSSSSSSKKSSSNKLRWPLGYNRMNSNVNKPNAMDQIRCVYEFVVNSLQRNTKYGFIVQAFNSKGAGPTSPEVYAQTLLKDPPGKPIIKLTNVSLYEASFVWAMPAHQAEADLSNDIINDFVDLDQTPSVGSTGSINIEGFIIYYRPLIKRLASQPQSSSYQSSAPGEEYSEGSIQEEEDDRFIGKKYQAINWETISVSNKQNGYTLKNLRCGTLYQVRLEAFNEMGSGQSSDVLQFSTLGQAPTVPQSNAFIVANITWAMLDLDRWNNGLCPIINFALRYRLKDPKSMAIGTDGDPRSNNGWITVSSHLKPEFGSMYIIRDLLPGSWYELSIIATNDAGETESRYLFSTLTVDGTTVEPLYASDFNRRHLGVIGGQADSIFEDPMILIPATCAILVLLVIGAATLFIFITRSKEALSRTEHFCRHRDTAHRSHDQLSLNLFSSKNHSKSDLIRSSYQDGSGVGGAGGDKLTQIETLNCGQTEMMMNGNGGLVQSSQYVEGPTSLTTYTTSGGDDPSSLPPIMDITNGGTPSRRVKLTNGKTVMESFYSTPCIATQSSNSQQQQHQQQQQVVQLAQQGQFLAQTLGKQGSNKVMMNQHESIYGDSSTAAQQAQQHSYYTHSQFLGGSQENGPASMVQPGLVVKKKSSDKNHIYELPKQQLQQQQSLDGQSQPFEQNDANFVMLVMQQQQTQRAQTLQSPHRIRAEQQQQQAQHQFRSFHQQQNF